ncbi:phytanoyl-CoA dioxygenase family protein [Kribbella sp. NBC_00662]|uniref:phytanoyl-CoA dioxygenase family protein n=1 Tax=Kribbella sp. NBC_00662 TaxID=2975969 RepID=UPI0032473122
MKELTDSHDLVPDAAALRARLAADGYLFFRGLLPVEVVTDVHAQLARILYDSDWLDRDADPRELVASGRAVEEGSAGFFGAYTAIQSTQAFHELAVRPELIGLAGRLLGEEAFAHPAHICRIAPPSPGANPTPIHQDYRFIQGSVDTLTTWLPLSAAPPEIGGLRVYAGSPRLGVLPVKASDGPGMMRAEADENHPEWRTTSYQPGDVLLFGSLTVHGAMPNRTNRLRLSADFRYQARSAPMARDMLGTGKPHYHPDVPDFPTLTRGWTSTESVEVPAGVNFVDRWDPRVDDVPTPQSRFAYA